MLLTDERLRELHARWVRVCLYDQVVLGAAGKIMSSASEQEQLIAAAIASSLRPADAISCDAGSYRYAVARANRLDRTADVLHDQPSRSEGWFIDFDRRVFDGGGRAAARAAGLALALGGVGDDAVVVAIVDPGARSTAATLSALRLPEIHRLPIVLVVCGAHEPSWPGDALADQIAATGVPTADLGVRPRSVIQGVDHAVDHARRHRRPCCVVRASDRHLRAGRDDPAGLDAFEEHVVEAGIATASELAATRDATRLEIEHMIGPDASALDIEHESSAADDAVVIAPAAVDGTVDS